MPRRHGSRRRRKRPDPFLVAVRNAPIATETRKILIWDMSRNIFDIISFNFAEAQNRITGQEMNNLFQEFYQSPYGQPKPFKWHLNFLLCYGCSGVVGLLICLLGSLGILELLITTEYTNIPYIVGSLLSIIWCCIIGITEDLSYKRRLIGREIKLKQLTSIWNQKYKPKGISFTAGKYAAYLIMDLEFLIKQRAEQGPSLIPANMVGESNNVAKFNGSQYNQQAQFAYSSQQRSPMVPMVSPHQYYPQAGNGMPQGQFYPQQGFGQGQMQNNQFVMNDQVGFNQGQQWNGNDVNQGQGAFNQVTPIFK